MIISGTQNENQRTPEWIKSRMGRFSCSQLHRLMTDPKAKADKEAGKLSDGAITYVMECIAEKITGKPAKEDFTSKYTDWGVLHEPIAIGIYEEVFQTKVTQSGYIPYGENFGGSPDGLVDEVAPPEWVSDMNAVFGGGVEIKCPFTITAHLVHSLTTDLKADYKECYWQIIGYMIITGRQWFDFVSYHPEYPGKYQFKRIRIERKNVLQDIELAQDKINKATQYLNLILNSI
jgi:hypothetical protein